MKKIFILLSIIFISIIGLNLLSSCSNSSSNDDSSVSKPSNSNLGGDGLEF